MSEDCREELYPEAEEDTIVGISCGLLSTRVRRQVEEALVLARTQQSRRDVLAAAASSKRREAERVFEQCKALDIKVVSRLSPHYPALLQQAADPPFALYVRSRDIAQLSTPEAVAIVGTRAASVVQCEAVKLFAGELAESGVTVVSGLALGIDGAAHRGVLYAREPSRTIAVLAHGLNMVYPPSHTRLAEGIVASGGAVVSEYPPGTEARKHHFLERNRIIAGLVRGVIVFQAGERSGSLVTARFAAEYGRDVFVVLGGSSDEGANAGGAKLAEEGAKVVVHAQDVLNEYGVRKSQSHGALARGHYYSAAEFARAFNFSAAELLALELEGIIVRLPGGAVLVRLVEGLSSHEDLKAASKLGTCASTEAKN